MNMSRQTNPFTPDCRALWLMLRNDGGWWTAAALLHHWRPAFTDYEIADALKALRAGDFIQAREQSFGQLSYCVTSDCKALPAAELMKAAA